MKKLLIVLAILIPVAVLAQGLPNLYIDGDNASIVAKTGQTLKLDSQDASGIKLISGHIAVPVATVAVAATPATTPPSSAAILVVPTAAANAGIRLSNTLAVGASQRIISAQTTPVALSIYPPYESTPTIRLNGLAAGALVTCAAGADCACIKLSSTAWTCSVN